MSEGLTALWLVSSDHSFAWKAMLNAFIPS